jgi:hypothetical protein
MGGMSPGLVGHAWRAWRCDNSWPEFGNYFPQSFRPMIGEGKVNTLTA